MTAIRTAVVIGGGVAGPVTALALRKAGIEASVYEAYDAPATEAGGALMLAPNGLAALKIVGIDKELQLAGQPMRTQLFAHGTGKRFARIPVLNGLEPSLMVSRGELCQLLYNHATACGIKMEYGKRLTDVDERSDGITARFADGTSASGDILIGADGIHSTVRRLIDPLGPGPQHAGLISFGAPAAASATPSWLKDDEIHFVMGKRAFFGYFRMRNGQTMWFSNLPYERPLTGEQARAMPRAKWMTRLREAYVGDIPAQQLIDASDPANLIVLGSMEAMPSVPRWYGGKMVLVGDSVHAPSSSSGQGASLTLESSIEIARCLRDLPTVSAAFAAFEKLRRERVELIAATAVKTNKQKSGGPVARLLIRALAPVFTRTFLTPEKMFGPVHRYRIDWDHTVKP
jgi:2-polyprenyl-6-methoxyphenol hydroxylase-like FAD-dependent oxidoreductase